MSKSKVIAFQVALTWLMSNIGFFMIYYAGYKLGTFGDHVFWKMMLYNGIYFCVGAIINAFSLMRFAP